jgi:hypothetical protein
MTKDVRAQGEPGYAKVPPDKDPALRAILHLGTCEQFKALISALAKP